MRLARSLVKAVIVLAVAAGALGGAAALGSTLWEEPPRDAAEFAARIARESAEAERERDASPAVRKYRVRLNRLCARAAQSADELKRRAARGEDAAAILRTLRRELASFDRSFRAIRPPKLVREQARRAAELNAAAVTLADDALAALRRGDRDEWVAKTQAAVLLDERFDALMREIGAGVCAAD